MPNNCIYNKLIWYQQLDVKEPEKNKTYVAINF